MHTPILWSWLLLIFSEVNQMGHWCGLWELDQGVRTLVSIPVKEHQLGCSRFPVPEEIITPLSCLGNQVFKTCVALFVFTS